MKIIFRGLQTDIVLRRQKSRALKPNRCTKHTLRDFIGDNS